MNDQHRKRWLLFAAGACVALLAADRFAVAPLTSVWKDRAARIKELQLSLEKGQTLLDRNKTLTERWKEIGDQALPADPPTAENQLLNQVNTWASEARFNVTVLKPRWIDDEKLGPRMEIRLSGAGSLESISRFLYALETSSLLLRVEDVQLRARDDSGRDLSLEARFSGLTAKGLNLKSPGVKS